MGLGSILCLLQVCKENKGTDWGCQWQLKQAHSLLTPVFPPSKWKNFRLHHL